MEPLWDHIRKVRDGIDYRGKYVLDIASFDGMFAFEAEGLGAKTVVATDCLYRSFSNLLFCREVLNSRVVPYYNVSPYNLVERLDVYLGENYDDEKPGDRLFDIVQHFGLLYHLRDPMLSLSQARSVLKTGGQLFIETEVVLDTDDSFMLYNGLPNTVRIRDNYTVWWAPTRTCLTEMLEATLFKVNYDSYSEIQYATPTRDTGRMLGARSSKQHRIGRAAVIAEAIDIGRNQQFERELLRSYRNPGLSL